MTDAAPLLNTDMLSDAPRGPEICREIAETPEIDEEPERRPLRLSERELDTGRLSGKRAFTIVIRSDGPTTMYGCTSAVSRKDVIERAGSSFVLSFVGLSAVNRAVMLSMCCDNSDESC